MFMSLLSKKLEGRIQKQDAAKNWEDAVRTAAQPLVKSGNVTPAYVDAMVENIHRLGSYMVLTPGMAMPHSRPEDGCLKGGVALLILDKPVLFPDDEAVWFILALGAESSEGHISTIEAIADFLSEDGSMEAIRSAKTIEEIAALIP